MQIDTGTAFDARVERRLHDEQTIWLTVVRSDGTPEPNPVWFLWDGSTFLIYGKRDSHKLEHLARDRQVSLNFNSNVHGGNVVVFTGVATIDASAPPADQNPPYLAKYQQDIQRIGLTPESFAHAYCASIRVTPTHLRGN
ncbi:MAG: TIGR03667 family PPOX class F420-dependent oxidoreductase [Chloroflexota bacterium]